jgi:hypothetical protein
MPFSIQASKGNQGRSGKSQASFWTPIPVLEMLKIDRSSAALRELPTR